MDIDNNKNEESEKQYRLQKHSFVSDEEKTMLKEEDYQCCRQLRHKTYFIEHDEPVDDEPHKLQVMQNHGVSLDECLARIAEQKEKDKEEYEHSLERWEKREKNEL